MNLADKQVIHKTFGKGSVVKYSDSYIKIGFPSGNKEFIFPDAFEKYLTFIDQKAANLVEKMLKERRNKYKKEKQELKKLKALRNNKWQHLLEENRHAKRRKPYKIHPRSQSVFWCKTGEQDIVFEKWRIFSGVIKSGPKKGNPRRLARVNQNSACLLTARDSDMPEKDRRILGAFMVNDTFSGKKCVDGYIPAHSEHRFRLSKQEFEKMLFWDYYVDKRYPHKMTWNTGRHRYFDNIWMAQILRDIISLKKKPREREHVQRFFEYFCKMNQINKGELPKPNGALMRN
jgi:hypothetical protein